MKSSRLRIEKVFSAAKIIVVLRIIGKSRAIHLRVLDVKKWTGWQKYSMLNRMYARSGTGFQCPVAHFWVSFISLRHQLLLRVSVRSASLEGDQVIHTVSVSVRCQTSRLSFPGRPPRAVLSAPWYALITALLQWQAVPENSKSMRLIEPGVCACVFAS